MLSASLPIEHVDPRELALFVHEKLPRIRAESIRAHVRSCKECEELLVSGLLSQISSINTTQAAAQQVEHRTYKRLPGKGTGYVQSICPLSFDRLAAEIVDRSDEGIGLIASSSLAIDALVQICVEEVLVLGDVRSCRPIEDGRFRLGVHVDYAKQHRTRAARA